MLAQNTKVLQERYTLTKLLSSSSQQQSWLATDQDGGPVLAKTWSYPSEQPNDVVRALWDRELRNLFRLSSSPDADAQLVVLRDAGVDKDNSCFVMILTAPGFDRLSDFLQDRAKCDWLRDVKQTEVRLPLWRGSHSLAQGLAHLHQQQMLHRALTAEVVLVDAARGPESMRLGGFEWTVKVGQSPDIKPLGINATAPEFLTPSKQQHTFESDWYQFGCLLAQIFAGADSKLVEDATRHKELLARVRDAAKLTELEREFISSLLERRPELRLSRGFEIISAIGEIIVRLDQPARLIENSYLALAVLLGPNRKLTDAICELDETISALDTERQRLLIESDLETARLIARPGSQGGVYLLQGNRLVYFVKEYSEPGSQPSGQWDLAFCDGTGEIRYSPGSDYQVELRRVPVRVFRVSDIRTDPSIVHKGAVSWRPFLPQDLRLVRAREKQERFHEFFRITNQIELLFRDAEIFPYKCISYVHKEGLQEAVIEERARERQLPSFAELSGGMAAFLRLQWAEKRDGDKVYLGPEQSVYLDRRVDMPEFWTIVAVDDEKGQVRLRRAGARLSKPLVEGFLRCFDMFGQISLIRRRKRAIDRLKGHNYLLKAIRSPDSVFIDTGESTLPQTVDHTLVDEAKLHALQNIWRTRPIFALQGPPGTGKTTLVANLLGQIFHDDSVAQVLVTAQAHSAVDVLREKVSTDIFKSSDEDSRPLAIRLSKAGDSERDEPDSIYNVALRILQRAEDRLEPKSAVEGDWLKEVQGARLALQREAGRSGASDFCELVKRSASIVYSTTTAGDLEELADLTQSFDWSLIEEAGKAHGFDLVLPLQTGHRWVLIGDQNQLPPYRFQDFRKGLLALDDVTDCLARMPERAGGLVDLDLIQTWRDLPDSDKAERQAFWKTWLPMFGQLHRTCTEAVPAPTVGEIPERGVLASMLWQQHRMHPTISGLISTAYYDRPIESMTVDAAGPLERVVHPFVAPSPIEKAQIVWIDVGWPNSGGQNITKVTRDEVETSNDEAEAIRRFLLALRSRPALAKKLRLAVLSPYRRQILKLSETLKGLYKSPPTWLAPLKPNEQPASTVDSFQGNQADVVVVSLVRRNSKPPGEGLGFLREASRMNVLFSRAERMLVLVGSWDFFKYQVMNASRDKNQPLGHWRLAIEYIEQCVREGRACIISSKTFEKERL
jgi:hypothetical protein